MKRFNLITPEGTRDLLFDECRARRRIENELMDLFKSENYSEVITPFLEFYDVFGSSPNGEMRGFTQESMYKLTDSKGRLMVIRPDSTLPIIRLAETRLKDEPRPLKLCYNQSIYRANPKEAGRDDEIVQCGVENIGGEDTQVLKLAVEAFKVLGIDFRFEIGNCSFFDVLIKENGIDAEKAERIRHLVETKNYPELTAMNIPAVFTELPKLFGGEEAFAEAEKLFKTDALKNILNKLKDVYNGLGENITVDLGLTNKRGYYTGILFNGYAQGYGKPVLTGGRYCINNTESIGFAVNVSAIAALRGME
jgi:ATP phosphoribosyltransferase regulatory subunit